MPQLPTSAAISAARSSAPTVPTANVAFSCPKELSTDAHIPLTHIGIIAADAADRYLPATAS